MKKWLPAGLFILMTMMQACTIVPPVQVLNVCGIFQEHPEWYWAAEASEVMWGTPIAVQMAIIHQESHFNAHAVPPRGRLLWVIPWARPTSAYGYGQILDITWLRYQHATHHGGRRDEFESAIDFVGWYTHQAQLRLKINAVDAHHLYLAYHEGLGGFERKTYLKKLWLIQVANKVQLMAQTYQKQLNACQSSLPEKPWWRFW